MYIDFYGLKEEPFNITPDPRFLYLTDQHQEALNHLLYGVQQRKGFILLTGEVGAGKTTLCRALLNRLGEKYQTALLLNPAAMSETHLLRAIAQEFGLVGVGRDHFDLLQAINYHLIEVNCAGQDAVLIVDEAQTMSVQALEMVRLLSNLETEKQKLLQIILVGQPELAHTLARQDLRQLSQRITVRYHLGTMTRTDTAEYLRHRLNVAGLAGSSRGLHFEPSAVRAIHRFARGTPRLINALGDKALLAGYVSQTPAISRRLVRLAARELKGSVS
ncbi:MAG: AAA family ATPase [Planctomycetaceae bacterium]|nr:AAA family ATPase [Planctomycetaceae bacterium]